MSLSKIVDEQKAYERQRSIGEKCGLSWIQATTAIVLNGVAHAGTAAHICALRPHEGGKACRCACGVSQLVKK